MENARDSANIHARPLTIPAASNRPAPPEKNSAANFKWVPADPQTLKKQCPATPRMMYPAAAWRLLCLRTGGAISLGTFYRWIRDGRLCTIRLGKKIMVPAQMLDDVIEKCLKGDGLL